MNKLKGVIFSIRDVIVENGQLNENKFSEVIKLIQFLQSKNIMPVVLTQHSWVNDESEEKTSLKEMLFKSVNKFPWYCCDENEEIPKKDGSAKPVEYILNMHGWQPNDIIYVGNSPIDMRASLNSKVLFLNALWHHSNTIYGFCFNSPRDIAKFIDIFCLREHFWEFAIEEDGLRVYALSTYSTYINKYILTSMDAKIAAKQGRGKLDFWSHYLISSIYFSGLYLNVNYITSYPGHKIGTGNTYISDVLDIFAKCFKITYIPDLIIRHNEAPKSQFLRNNSQQPTHLNQLNTIHMNKNPIKNSKGDRYKHSPLNASKTVLIIDDILTEGFSLDAAREYIEATGAKVIALAWLKTYKRDYHKGEHLTIENPYNSNKFVSCKTDKIYGYYNHIIDQNAQTELGIKFNSFDEWNWPDDAKK